MLNETVKKSKGIKKKKKKNTSKQTQGGSGIKTAHKVLVW